LLKKEKGSELTIDTSPRSHLATCACLTRWGHFFGFAFFTADFLALFFALLFESPTAPSPALRPLPQSSPAFRCRFAVLAWQHYRQTGRTATDVIVRLAEERGAKAVVCGTEKRRENLRPA